MTQREKKEILLENYRMRKALQRIERWFGEFPEKTLSTGEVVSYGSKMGSNGERDFMRAVARNALSGIKPNADNNS